MKILKNHFSEDNAVENHYPFIPLREMVIFPGLKKSFYVGRVDSVEAVNLSVEKYDKIIVMATQKDPAMETPKKEDIYRIGVIAKILEVRPGPEKNIIKLTVKGIRRVEIEDYVENNSIKKVKINEIEFRKDISDSQTSIQLDLIVREFKKFSALAKIPFETLKSISEIDNLELLINTLMSFLKVSIDKQIETLQELDINKRLFHISEYIAANIEIYQLDKKINLEVKRKMEKSQKEYYLNEQIKEIQKELGTFSDDSDFFANIEEFKKKLNELGLPEYAVDKALKEYKRLQKTQPMSPEAGIIRTYIEWILDLPWQAKTEDSRDFQKSKEILNRDHYSLNKVKNRILEFLAVRQLNNKTKGPILCFVGPPGTGKTSLGKSVAMSLGREFVRISLGGVRDEAEIRGHRRTYLGALPGKIIQSMKKVKTINPVFLLDEIDKMSSDFRGDPASALLEVLDPEQNFQFSDHYLEIPYNLSETMFIATANSIQGIPYPLLDRMEIINISGYTEAEKMHIARNFLLKKEMEENGITGIDFQVTDRALLDIIRYYTMEAGVRSLQRQIASLCRKTAKLIVLKEMKITKIQINRKNLSKFLGKKKYVRAKIDEVLDVGISHGLAWTEIGGTLLPIEAVLYPGSGKIVLTGKLGEVMKESAQTAFSYLRANAYLFDIKYEKFYKDYDVHIHFPEGATPKDGPSGGIAICCAILSALTKIPMNSNVAMTGEITLTGKVLPIGGLKEKSLAAARHKKDIVIIPNENEKDLVEIPRTVRKRIKFMAVEKILQVFDIVFDKSIYADAVDEKEKKKPFNNISDDNFDAVITQ
ncbi:MAG TPA: endopeptidase La [Spirochaetota bacterium]|nr:endopeptidase La [Spirochaetota bacterium]HOS31921.1 endopeptidase La [Spirochaetota bacterium]HOS55170.1 endopeptidase La [Spirochaetota bacterium]HPK62121.1 endopeptidase La [Spirochaetota bacterium]HQF77001.1 endopeptidase La [Spirochaetota bacterium]